MARGRRLRGHHLQSVLYRQAVARLVVCARGVPPAGTRIVRLGAVARTHQLLRCLSCRADGVHREWLRQRARTQGALGRLATCAQSVSLLCEGGGKAIVRERASESRDLQLEDGQG